MVGPKTQDDLFKILLRFRKHKIALSADITKMYRQIALKKSAKDFQRIVWRWERKRCLRTLPHDEGDLRYRLFVFSLYSLTF